MATTNIGGVIVTSYTDDAGNINYTATLPSGLVAPISRETLNGITDPAYVAQKQASTISKLTNSSDIEATKSFYAAAPTELPAFEQQVGGEAIQSQFSEPGLTNATNENNLGDSPADDDSSYNKSEAAILAAKQNDALSRQAGQSTDIQNAFAGTTTSGSAQNTDATGKPLPNRNVGSTPKPGTRLQNPLGNFATYTYQLSLYMITPDAYNAFTESGRKNINALGAVDVNGNATNGGAFLIAQSGGINNKTSRRAPGFDLDYYIDDLKIITNTSGKSTQTASNMSELHFNIYEPYGFSFITKLKRAFSALKSVSRVPNYSKSLNASKQFFILGIRFQGYDENGNIANASEFFSDGTQNLSPDASGVYERFYDITINELKFKISGTATTYNITAALPQTQTGLGIARGRVNSMTPISAATVKEALDGSGPGINSLFGALNQAQQTLLKNNSIEIPNKYSVRYLGDTSGIQSATLASDADLDKKKIAMSRANKSSQVNEATSSGAVANPTRRLITFNGDISIAQAIKKIIMQSSYLEDAMKVIYDTSEEPNPNTNSPDQVTKKNPPPIKWYNLSTEIKILGFDTKVGDFAYDITYVIQPYETPASYSPYTQSSQYYGPHKRYQYWFTGKNTEVLAYEQSLDNLFFNVVVNGTGDGAAQSGGASVPVVPGKRQNQDRQGRLDDGNETQNAYMTSLFDPGSYAEAKISILGDPDFLLQETPSSISEIYNQFYGTDGFTINPNGGQVFVEVVFNEAQDYDNKTGTLDVNQNILFWQYPQDVANKIKGVVFMVIRVESTFSKGKFTQVLYCTIKEFPASQTVQDDTGRPASSISQKSTDIRPGNTDSSSSGNTPTPSAGNNTSGNTGYTTDKPIADSTSTTAQQDQINQAAEFDAFYNYGPPKNTTQTSTIATLNGPVADDDSVPASGQTQAGSATANNPDAGRETPNDTLNSRFDYSNLA